MSHMSDLYDSLGKFFVAFIFRKVAFIFEKVAFICGKVASFSRRPKRPTVSRKSLIRICKVCFLF